MQNYIGIGVDAKVALEWPSARQIELKRFTSVLRNKICYARYGLKHLFGVRACWCAGPDREERLLVAASPTIEGGRHPGRAATGD